MYVHMIKSYRQWKIIARIGAGGRTYNHDRYYSRLRCAVDEHYLHFWVKAILQDDLGNYDSGITNPEAAAWSGNITTLAKAGQSRIAQIYRSQ